MNVKSAFETLTSTIGLISAGAVAAVALVGAVAVSHIKSDGALEGISQRLRQSNADRVPEAYLMGNGRIDFMNTVTGARGKFELMGRERKSNGQTCYSIAITDGDFSGASATITDKGGKTHKVAMATTVCP